MAKITPVAAPGVPGTVPTWTAATVSGDKLRAGSGVLLVRNASGVSITVTIPLPGTTRFGQALPDPTPLTIAAGAIGVIGPFENDLADSDDNLVDVTYSAVASVTVLLLDA